VKLALAIGRVLESVKSRAGRRAFFGTGIAVPFVGHLPASGSRAPTSVSRGRLEHTSRRPRLEPCSRLSCGFLRLPLLSWMAVGE
jgi:hypothetical protein